MRFLQCLLARLQQLLQQHTQHMILGPALLLTFLQLLTFLLLCPAGHRLMANNQLAGPLPAAWSGMTNLSSM